MFLIFLLSFLYIGWPYIFLHHIHFIFLNINFPSFFHNFLESNSFCFTATELLYIFCVCVCVCWCVREIPFQKIWYHLICSFCYSLRDSSRGQRDASTPFDISHWYFPYCPVIWVAGNVIVWNQEGCMSRTPLAQDLNTFLKPNWK